MRRTLFSLSLLSLSACTSIEAVPLEAQLEPAPAAPLADAAPDSASAPPILDYKALHHPVIGRYGIVASQERLASEIGARILEEGGNAVDAAVAVGFALAVTLPRAGNIAGGGFMLIYDAETDTYIALDYKEMAPLAASADMYVREDGSVDLDAARYRHTAFGVPGTVSAFAKALDDYGTMDLAEVLQPSIELARDGIVVTHDLSASITFAQSRLAQNPAAAEIFLNPDGSPLRAGQRLVQTDLARSLERIAQHGADDFYSGLVAKRIVADQKANGGLVTMDDMAGFITAERIPVTGNYRDHGLVIMPPPSSGGIHIIQMLNVLEHFDIRALGHNSSATMHVMIEAMRQAYADRSVHLGDPDFNDIPADWLMSEAYADQTLAAIEEGTARRSDSVNPGVVPLPESPDTTHFSVMDQFGNAVSNTYSLNYSFGSGIVAADTGILLNNVMDDFSAQPGVPNGYGLVGGEANAIAPRKRALSSMTPTMITRDGKPYVVTGSPGGSRIITTVLQIVMNVIDHQMNIADATHAPRFHHQWLPDTVFIEPIGFSADTLARLEDMGHALDEARFTMGSTQSIMRDGEYFYGSSDPRRPAAATIAASGPN